ncbi:MAG TPA: DUF1080 domain-containing protein, partial [Parafilimonas sp.]
MKKVLMFLKSISGFVLIIFVLLMMHCSSAKANSFTNKDEASVIGRWDITINMDGKQLPSWLEIHRSGLKTL